mmetsp:Transcript_19442/g.60145  ORF Transcript_19442/g.60145 Transcript_19442/m.60145 type:complete len:283 (+) Transcript_19442:435-1283(+)
MAQGLPPTRVLCSRVKSMFRIVSDPSVQSGTKDSGLFSPWEKKVWATATSRAKCTSVPTAGPKVLATVVSFRLGWSPWIFLIMCRQARQSDWLVARSISEASSSILPSISLFFSHDSGPDPRHAAKSITLTSRAQSAASASMMMAKTAQTSRLLSGMLSPWSGLPWKRMWMAFSLEKRIFIHSGTFVEAAKAGITTMRTRTRSRQIACITCAGLGLGCTPSSEKSSTTKLSRGSLMGLQREPVRQAAGRYQSSAKRASTAQCQTTQRTQKRHTTLAQNSARR